MAPTPPPAPKPYETPFQSSAAHTTPSTQSADRSQSDIQRAMSPNIESCKPSSNVSTSISHQRLEEDTGTLNDIATASQKKNINKEACVETVSASSTQMGHRSKTPFERAKSKLERKIERAKSPTMFIEHGRATNDETIDVATKNMIQNEINSGVYYSQEQDKTKDQDRLKKTSGEGDRSKSMYKKLTSKFNKSSNNVSEETVEVGDGTEEKFKLKRPSIFMKVSLK